MPGKKHGGGCRNALAQSAFQGRAPPDASRRQPSGDEFLRGAGSPTRHFRVSPERPETPPERFAVPTTFLRPVEVGCRRAYTGRIPWTPPKNDQIRHAKVIDRMEQLSERLLDVKSWDELLNGGTDS